MTGALGVGSVTAPTTAGLIRAANDIIAYASSDERLKENKTILSEALNKVNQLNGYEFDWIPMFVINENEGHDIGVIAQEVEKIIPEIVTTRDNGYMAVKYEKMVPLLIEAIKELSNKVTELENQLKNK
jgi:methionine aminopeptidase